jgi:pimeloyl-ACP methyl ester carboxylesterase
MGLEEDGLRDGYAELADVRLHYVEAGDGPLIVLLHGFPEFWFGWRSQIPELAAAGFRVVAPDMRGYNLSSRPHGVAAYDVGRVARDICELIKERGGTSVGLAGHDWGGGVAWTVAITRPEVVRRLAILNVPHPRPLRRGLRTPRQLAKSWYILFFQLPWLPERIGLRYFLRGMKQDSRPGAFTQHDLARYSEAWSQPGAPRGMIN